MFAKLKSVPTPINLVLNPHQRCKYSDSPIARILFYTTGSRNGLEGVGPRERHPQEEAVPKKKYVLSYRKIC